MLQRDIAEQLGVDPHAFAQFAVQMRADYGTLEDALDAAREELADEDQRLECAVRAQASSKNFEMARRKFNAERGENISWGALKRLLLRAAERGLDGSTPAPPPIGQVIKGLSTLHVRDPDTGEMRVSQVWTKTKAEERDATNALKEAAAVLSRKVVRVDPVAPPPAFCNSTLCVHYPLADGHVGMHAWGRETGRDWSLKDAERVIGGCFDALVEMAPPAETAIVAILGDWLHYDSLDAVTPMSKHLLDGDSRFPKMAGVGASLARRLVMRALQKHKFVKIAIVEGNHDPASSQWLSILMEAVFENEPRVEVLSGPSPYLSWGFGNVMISWHHGHLTKPGDALALVFANDYPAIWASGTALRVCHTGHFHHRAEIERTGMDFVQHPTLASRDSYAHRGGWRSVPRIRAHVYHATTGEAGVITISPLMLEAT
jgi:hypothetical protein